MQIKRSAPSLYTALTEAAGLLSARDRLAGHPGAQQAYADTQGRLSRQAYAAEQRSDTGKARVARRTYPTP